MSDENDCPLAAWATEDIDKWNTRIVETGVTQADGSLTFSHLRQVNLDRCVNAFNHNLSDWSLSDWFTATMGELGEAANIAKKLNRIRDGIDDANAEHETPTYLQSELADEIADTAIYLDLLAASEGIALDEAIAAKFNKTSEKLDAPHRLSARHIDEADFAEVAHHTHACQSCGFVWRPAKVNTHGVQFLPGYSND